MFATALEPGIAPPPGVAAGCIVLAPPLPPLALVILAPVIDDAKPAPPFPCKLPPF